MKTVLAVHNYYQHRGGEDAVFERETELLERHGHKVVRHIVHNDVIGDRKSFLVALQATWNRQAYADLRKVIRSLHPDVVHIHNFFPLISPAVYFAAHAEGASVIQTLHNYRLLCPNGLLFRSEQVCESCLTRLVKWPSVHYACYRGSAFASGAVALMDAVHLGLRTWHRRTDALIALSEFSKRKFIEGGLPEHLLFVKPNFVDLADPECGVATPYKREGALYVGRLSGEKGVRFLVKAWDNVRAPLRVIGTGPLASELRARAVAHVSFLQQVPAEDVYKEMRTALFLVFPSLCYENMSLVLVEAFAMGLPVIASNIGGISEIVENGRSGILFAPGNRRDFQDAVNWAFAHPDEMIHMGYEARRVYETRFSAELNYRQLVTIYDTALRNRAQSNFM